MAGYFELAASASITLEAAGDLSAHAYKGALVDTAGQAALATGAALDIDGVFQNELGAAIGEPTLVLTVPGTVTKAIAGASVTQGAEVAVNATGLFIDAVATDVVVGIALTGTAAANEVFAMLYRGHGGVKA